MTGLLHLVHDSFDVWFISAFLIGFGIAVVAQIDRFGDPAYFFKREIRDCELGSRFKAVLDRRRAIEGFPGIAYTVVGGVSIAFGVLTALKLVLPVVAYANVCFVLAGTAAVVFARMRNRGIRRAAALSPRSPGTAINPMWYGCAAVSSLLPLIFLGMPAMRLAAVLVTLSSLSILAMSVRTATMASILTGEDNELELLIDERLRTARVATLLCFAYTVPFVFFGIGGGKETAFYQSFAFAWCGAFWLAYFSWFVVRCYFRGPLRLRA